ncbi:MAG: 4a-hydroxytetrahydrobiopterin dehydratase [Gemmatimonadales bacterium]
MARLADRHAKPLPKGSPALSAPEVNALLAELGGGWAVRDGKLAKAYTFPDFAQALAFTNVVGALAETENHHPDVHLAWGKVEVVVWTHSVGGLSENDFILAAKIESAT